MYLSHEVFHTINTTLCSLDRLHPPAEQQTPKPTLSSWKPETMNNEGIILIDADDESITVTWPPIGKVSASNPARYSLQFRPSTSATDNGIDSGASLMYTSLSNDSTSTTAKKKNLTGAGHGFWFRVSAATKIKTRVDKSSMEYVGHACRRPFTVLTMMEESRRMKPPACKVDHATASPTPNSYVVHVSWKPYGSEGGVDDVLGYKLQMRENVGESCWTTVGPLLTGTEVKKKNLTSTRGYMFRVRPVLRGETGGRESNLETSVSEGGNVVPFSCASDIVGAKKSSGAATAGGSSNDVCDEFLKIFKKLPKDELLAKGGMEKTSLSSAFLGVDLVMLYASAYWCPPCRKYTPELVQFYKDAKRVYKTDPKRTKSVEIVFVSADHDVNGFRNYYSSMPWLAVPYDAETRERLLAWMKVSGVPRLMVLDGKTGKILENNSVGRTLDLARFSKMVGGMKMN